MGFEHLKGFRDIFPEDAQIRRDLFRKIEDLAILFGFTPIEYPSVEPIELFRIKSGDELLKQTFSFRDRGDREVTLIPEATPSTVRLLVSRKDMPKPVRWYSIPKLWRYEEPQSGRLREHVQFNADIFGSDSEYSDAEIIGLAASILDTLGLGGEYEIRINDRNLMNHIMSILGVTDKQTTLSVIDHFGKVDRETLLSELRDAGNSEDQANVILKLIERALAPSDLMNFLSTLMFLDDETIEDVNRLERTCSILQNYTESRIVVNLSTVRGLGYYTGIVFEGFDRRGELRAIFGGGRYDNLAQLVSGQNVSAVGFGMGDAVLEILLKRTEKWILDRKMKKYAVCCSSRRLSGQCLNLALKLRRNGIIAITDLNGRSLSAQLKNAVSNECDYAIILGENDLEAGKMTLRELKGGEQTQVSIDDLLKMAKQTDRRGDTPTL